MSFKSSRSEITERRDPMQEFANRIIEALEKGVKPWVRPWDPDKAGGPQSPFNPTTQKVYHGVNVLILAMDMRAFETGDPRWMTYQQAAEKKWQIRKGEKSTTIFFTKPLEVDDDKTEDGKKTLHFLRSYAVFHASQVDGISPYKAPTVEEAPWRRPEAADIILKNSGATVRIGGDRAFYSPTTDHIQLPPEHAFHGPAEWAATALHEGIHWSGAKHRLNRDQSSSFGSAKYADEELVAEIGSAFLGSTLGIPTEIANHASYIGHWLKKLKDDKRFIFKAAAAAQKASDYMMAFHPDFSAQQDPSPERPLSDARRHTEPEPQFL